MPAAKKPRFGTFDHDPSKGVDGAHVINPAEVESSRGGLWNLECTQPGCPFNLEKVLTSEVAKKINEHYASLR